MRHQVLHHRLGRGTPHRLALLRNMAVALFRHERIETTNAKAKALRPFAERLITLAKRGDLHARRLAAEHVHDHEILQKLFAELAERYRARAGGYTRVLKTGFRRGDAAPMALIELVDAVLKKPAAAEGAETTAKGAATGSAAPTKESKRAEPKAEPKAEAKAEAKKAKAKPEAKPRKKAEAKADSKAEAKPKKKKEEAKPATKSRKK